MILKCTNCGSLNQIPPHIANVPVNYLRCGICNVGMLQPFTTPKHSGQVASGALGAGIGAALGSVFPGLGTWAGGLLGGFVGAWMGRDQEKKIQ